jgi:hypothetical protein
VLKECSESVGGVLEEWLKGARKVKVETWVKFKILRAVEFKLANYPEKNANERGLFLMQDTPLLISSVY